MDREDVFLRLLSELVRDVGRIAEELHDIVTALYEEGGDATGDTE